MKLILSMTAIMLISLIGFQTLESARTHEISITCEAEQLDSETCISLGPIGTMNPSGVEFWVRGFITHTAELPSKLRDGLRNSGFSLPGIRPSI